MIRCSRYTIPALSLLLLFGCAGPVLRGGALDALPELKDYRAARVSSYDRTGGNADALHNVAPGETRVLADIEGPGMITHIWFTINAEPFHGRKIVLRMYWDDEAHPSVLVPVNDFFCAGHGINANLWSIPITVTSQGRARNSFFKMPFNKRARIEIENQGLEPIGAFYYYIDYRKYSRPVRDIGYFHAHYRQEYPAIQGQNYVICSAKGRGHFVGCNISIESNEDSWWGEGDDRIFIDGEEYPSMHGTGAEDYLNDAWGVWPGSSPYYGSSIHEGHGYQKGARYTCYRFHVEDPIPFNESFLMEIETYGARFMDGRFISGFIERADNWSSVAYWYQTEPHVPLGPLPAVDLRLPMEAARDRALLGFMRRAEESTGEESIETLREEYDRLLTEGENQKYRSRLVVSLAKAERNHGNEERAEELLLPYVSPFVDRILTPMIWRILGKPAIGFSDVEPLVLECGDGIVRVEEREGIRGVVTSENERKRYIYFALPPDSPLRDLDDTVIMEIRYYSEGRPGDNFTVNYDSFYSDDILGIYRTSEVIAKPETAGWYTAFIECSRARFGGRQNCAADFRIDSNGNGDECISKIRISVLR